MEGYYWTSKIRPRGKTVSTMITTCGLREGEERETIIGNISVVSRRGRESKRTRYLETVYVYGVTLKFCNVHMVRRGIHCLYFLEEYY